MKLINKLWIAIGVLIIFSPFGLLLPRYFKAGGAWGQWGADEMQGLIGYIPKGLARLSSLWNAPIPDYAFKGQKAEGLLALSFGYIASALIGILVIVGVVFLIAKLLSKK